MGSFWTVAAYRALRATAPYAEALDLVVEDRDGRFAACCICWADPTSGAGHFEPVGTRPDYRGKGLTTELIREGFRRLADRGMTIAHTETPVFNAPALALYEASAQALDIREARGRVGRRSVRVALDNTPDVIRHVVTKAVDNGIVE